MWSVLIYLSFETNGGFLCEGVMNRRILQKKMGISWAAERLWDSHEELSLTELIV
jgi:hypothetical protein